MIIKKHLVQYGKGFETPKLSKWQRAKTGVGKVGRGIAKVPKTVVVASGATAVALPKAAIAGTVSGIGSTLYSPVRLAKAVGKTLYHGSKGLSREAKRFIAWRRYKSAKEKLKASSPSNNTSTSSLKQKTNNLYAKLKSSTGRVYETRKKIGKSLLNVAKDVTPYRAFANGVRGSVESLKKTAKYTGKRFDILGSDTLKKLQPTSMAKIIMDTGTKKTQPLLTYTNLEKQIQNNLTRKQPKKNGQVTGNTEVKAKAVNYLALNRLKKQQDNKLTKIQKIRATPEYNLIKGKYENDGTNAFNAEMNQLEKTIKKLAQEIPKLGMFDPDRAKMQKQYDTELAKFNLYDAVKTIKENPTLFSQAI